MVVVKIDTAGRRAYCEWKGIVPDAQCGFRRRRSTLNMMFVLRRLQEPTRENKSEKAHDPVDCPLLWKVLVLYGIPAEGDVRSLLDQ